MIHFPSEGYGTDGWRQTSTLPSHTRCALTSDERDNGLASRRSAKEEWGYDLSQPIKPVRRRQILRDFLQEQICEREGFDPSQELFDLLAVLKAAVDGLDCLDGGEVRPIFRPSPTKSHGISPVSAKHLRMLARFYETLLREQNLPAKMAISEIAGAFQVSIDAVKAWKKNKTLSPIGNPKVKSLLENQNSLKKLGHHTTLKGLRAEIKRLGGLYQKANLKKKSGKNPP